MQEWNCLIVEDEPLAAGIIESYIRKIPGMNLCAICNDVFAANDALRKFPVDVIFLDINLPEMNGLDFIRSLRSNVQIILTTAYHQHALDAYNLNVTDYLLKPISFQRFMQAVGKLKLPETTIASPPATERRFHFFATRQKQVKVFTDEILYIESQKDYIKIFTSSGEVVTKMQLHEIEELLAQPNFCRIHKSFLVNLDKLSAFSAYEVEIGNQVIPIGRTYAEWFKSRMSNSQK